MAQAYCGEEMIRYYIVKSREEENIKSEERGKTAERQFESTICSSKVVTLKDAFQNLRPSNLEVSYFFFRSLVGMRAP